MSQKVNIDIVMIPVGTVGDVYPYLSLGQALKRKGYRITIITSAYFDTDVRNAGLDFIPLGTRESYLETISKPELWQPGQGFRILAKDAILPYLEPLFDLLSVYDPKQTILISQPPAISARIAHEKYGIPLITVLVEPCIVRSNRRMTVFAPRLPWLSTVPSAGIRMLYWGIDTFVIDPAIKEKTNRFRHKLGLPHVSRLYNKWVLSPQRIIGLVPDWFLPPQPDWPSHFQLTGFIPYRDGKKQNLPVEIDRFLDKQSKCLVFTPCTGMANVGLFFKAALDACERLRVGCIFITPYREQLPTNLPSNVAYCSYAPFNKLLKRVDVLVHNGGIGTIAQCLEFGVPQAIIPMAFDQPDNAVQVKRLNAGKFLAPHKLNGYTLAKILEELLGSTVIQDSCKDLARKIDTEKYIEDTCTSIEDFSFAYNLGIDSSTKYHA